MQSIHKDITLNSHLKHEGRLQYSLFLKGAGLSLEDSLNFFKKKFLKKTPEDKFDKDYAYNIRHSYGQEGKRVDYPPYSCTKIQNMKLPSSGETHGCPFKIYSEEKMKKMLIGQNIKEIDILRIMEKKKNNEPSVACMRYYEATHNNDNKAEKVGISPNGYFNSSIEYHKRNKQNMEKNLNEKAKVKIGYEINDDKKMEIC